MNFEVLSNITNNSDIMGVQLSGKVILGAGEQVAVHRKSWNDDKPFVFIDAPGYHSALRVHKSILKPTA